MRIEKVQIVRFSLSEQNILMYFPKTEKRCMICDESNMRELRTEYGLSLTYHWKRSMTTNIKQLDVLKPQDWKFLEGLWDKYSKYEHDQAEESKVPLPTPANIEEDIKLLSEWQGDFNRRVQEFNKA